MAAANSELAQVGTAAQAAVSDLGTTFTPQILDEAALKGASTEDVEFASLIQGKLTGAYWITANGTVFFKTPGVTDSPGTDKGSTVPTATTAPVNGSIVTSSTAGDPTYPNLYYDETTNQFVSTMPLDNGGSGPGATLAP